MQSSLFFPPSLWASQAERMEGAREVAAGRSERGGTKVRRGRKRRGGRRREGGQGGARVRGLQAGGRPAPHSADKAAPSRAPIRRGRSRTRTPIGLRRAGLSGSCSSPLLSTLQNPGTWVGFWARVLNEKGFLPKIPSLWAWVLGVFFWFFVCLYRRRWYGSQEDTGMGESWVPGIRR